MYRKQIISLCMIVKDDSELSDLKMAIGSLVDYVDEVCITATGKKTQDIEMYCQDNKYNYSYFKWEDDFAKARNYNFTQARDDADWVLWIDADDIIDGGEHIRWLAGVADERGYDCVFLPYWYSCQFNNEAKTDVKSINLRQMRERLMRPNKYKWVGRLHETPVAIDNNKNNYTAYREDTQEGKQIVVIHRSTIIDMDGKAERNMRIMSLQLEEERKRGDADPRTLLYLIKMIAENKHSTEEQYRTAVEYGQEYIIKSGWDEEIASCHEHMSICYAMLGETQKAKDALYKAIESWCHNPIIYLRLANLYYNNQEYRQARHWLEVASHIDLDNKHTSGIVNIQACKSMSAELALKLAYNQDKDIDKSVRYAQMLYDAVPSKDNEENMYFLMDKQLANEACKNVVGLTNYLKEAGDIQGVINVINALPSYLKDLNFATKIIQEVTPSRVWGDNEICYYATFGSDHFEKWDETSLQKGIGGSETAVIRLAQEWAKKGYKVTVYGDPITEGERDGVTWLNYRKFNWRDSFNILISWRSWGLSDKIKARKFLVDLHDMYSQLDFSQTQIEHIDKLMVKSNYHREIAPKIPSDKFNIISNGI